MLHLKQYRIVGGGDSNNRFVHSWGDGGSGEGLDMLGEGQGNGLNYGFWGFGFTDGDGCGGEEPHLDKCPACANGAYVNDR